MVVFACAYLCPTHIVLWFCLVCHRLVYPMLTVLLDCLFLIAPSIFSTVFLQNTAKKTKTLSNAKLHTIMTCLFMSRLNNLWHKKRAYVRHALYYNSRIRN